MIYPGIFESLSLRWLRLGVSVVVTSSAAAPVTSSAASATSLGLEHGLRHHVLGCWYGLVVNSLWLLALIASSVLCLLIRVEALFLF